MRELGREILRGREFQTKQKANVTIEFCLLHPKSSKEMRFLYKEQQRDGVSSSWGSWDQEITLGNEPE